MCSLVCLGLWGFLAGGWRICFDGKLGSCKARQMPEGGGGRGQRLQAEPTLPNSAKT